MIGGAEKLHRARLAIIAGKDARLRSLFRGQRIENRGDGLEFLLPADLLAEVAVVLQRESHQGSARRDGQNVRHDKESTEHEACVEDPFHRPTPSALQGRQPTLTGGCAHRQQHRIGGGHVVVASFAEEEKRERDQVHPRQHAIAPAQQERDQAADPHRRRRRIRADTELAAQEAFGPALANVAHMNGLQKVVRDEVVMDEPDEIGEKDRDRDGDAGQEVPAQEIATLADVSRNPPSKPAR